MEKKIMVLVVITVILVLGGIFFLFPNGSNNMASSGEKSQVIFALSKISSAEISEIVIGLSDLPKGYEISERGPRTFTDVSEEAIARGWKEGYSIEFQKGNTLFDISGISLWNSRYPAENIFMIINDPLNYSEEYTISELPSPNIGDISKAYKIKDTEWNTLTYRIDFGKKDIYVGITVAGNAADYELLRELAKKVENKI